MKRPRDVPHIERHVVDISAAVMLVAFPGFDWCVLINLRRLHSDGAGVVSMSLRDMERAILKARRMREKE